MEPTRHGTWLLLDRLAVGGMAEVFLAVRDGDAPDQLHALKRLLPALARDPEQVALFLDEARLMAELPPHPALLPVRELGRLGESYHLAYAYVPGQDLRAVFARAAALGEPLPPALAAAVGRDLADALEHVHRARGAGGAPLDAVHGDVSPGNVLLGYDGGVRLIDFGVAQAALRPPRAPGTGAGGPRGKVAYMSPEMAGGLPVDRRADVFALGVVLHELLTGERLFPGGRGGLDRLERASAGNVGSLAPSRRRPGLPAGLDAVVLRALAPDPADRFGWAAELRDALAPFAAPDARARLAAFLAEVFADALGAERARLARLRVGGGVGTPR